MTERFLVLVLPTSHECPTLPTATEKTRETVEYLHLQPAFWENGGGSVPRGPARWVEGERSESGNPVGPTQGQFF